jgi:hypothetical protein
MLKFQKVGSETPPLASSRRQALTSGQRRQTSRHAAGGFHRRTGSIRYRRARIDRADEPAAVTGSPSAASAAAATARFWSSISYCRASLATSGTGEVVLG